MQVPRHTNSLSERSASEERTVRSSPARLAVLGLVVERPAHRYELARRFSERVGPAWGIHRSQVYQLAEGLRRDGLAERVSEIGHGAASLEVFRATDQGRHVFETWLVSEVATDATSVRNSLFIRLAFLRPEHVPHMLRLIAAREQALLNSIREYSEGCPELSPATARTNWPQLGLHLILDGTVATLGSELSWLRRVRGTLEALPTSPCGESV
jgi:DNA-binding PadR family transcriptional regulator